MRVKSDPTMLAGEADVKKPTLCEVCLGDNPMVRMTRKPAAKACNSCGRPMTEFRWKAGTKGRFKVNVVCNICSRSQRVCQCCLHDLVYGVPVAVRNAILKKHGGSITAMATSAVMQDYQTSQMQAAVASGGDPLPGVPPDAHAELLRMMQARNRRGPDYSRNLPKFDTMAAKGEGTRGADNPYRTGPQPSHWIKDGKSIHNSIRDRFYGVDDAVATRQLDKWKTGGTKKALEPPADPSITTLWFGGVSDAVSETALREALAGHGPIARVSIVPASNCAFVDFASRAAAEAAAAATGSLLTVAGEPLRVDWSRRSGKAPGGGAATPAPAPAPALVAAGGAPLPPMPPPPGMPMPPAPGARGAGRPRGGGSRVDRRGRERPAPAGGALYPSMDPSNMGARSSLA